MASTLCVALFACRASRETCATACDASAATVDRHIAAYNRHDVDGLLANFDDSSAVFLFGEPDVIRTRAALRSTFVPMFAAYPHVHAEISRRIIVGPFVADQEQVTGVASADPATALSVYEVRNERLVNAWQTFVEADAPSMAAPASASAAASTMARSIAALNDHNAAAAAAAYGDTVAEHTLSSDTAVHLLTRDGVRANLERMFQRGGRMHVTVKTQMVVGSYVASEEHITGLPGGGTVDRLEVAQVNDNHIVADWHGQEGEAPALRADQQETLAQRLDDREILHASPP